MNSGKSKLTEHHNGNLPAQKILLYPVESAKPRQPR
jgi:hypothetical protein